MKRRKAIQRLGLGLSAGLLLPQFLDSCNTSNPAPEINYKGTVAVIGAGAAGLYAADYLRSKGVSVVVLEASGEMGGRIKSLRNQSNITNNSAADFPVELGAEITYGKNTFWGNIIQDLNIPYVDLTGIPNLAILDNIAKTEADWNSAGDSDFLAVQSFVAGLPNYAGSGTSVQGAATGVSARGQALLNSEAGNFYGSNSTQIGAQGLAQELKLLTRDNTWLTLKTNPMQDVLLSRFSLVTPKVLLNHPVQQISYSGNTVTISGVDQSGKTPLPYSIKANMVIVTVPLSILKSGDIAFSPALPAMITGSLANLGMDASIRISMDFKQNFWGYPINNRGSYNAKTNAFPSSSGSGTAGAILKGDVWTISGSGKLGSTSVSTGYSVAALVDNPGQTQANWYIYSGAITVLPTACIWGGAAAPQYFGSGAGRSSYDSTLSITINGPKAAELSAMGASMIDPILAELDLIYAGQASLNIRRDLTTNQPYSTIQDWSTETYIKGGYSYPLVNGTITDRANIGTPLDGAGNPIPPDQAKPTPQAKSNLFDKGVVFFAGEATDNTGDAGTVNGALASADRVANQVVLSIRGY